MSDPFDPVDQWLGTDIELLPPQAGAFERVHRRARRRKAVVAWSTATAVAVVVAGAVVVPQAVSSLLTNHGGNPEQVPVASGTQTSQPTRSQSTSPAPGHRPTKGQPGPSHLAITGSNQPPTPGIAPSSVTFVNKGTVGAVIGETTSGCSLGCEAIAATADYGRTWTKADAPRAGPPDGNSGVSQIRFLEETNGWAYGPGLYVTHDGGASWAKATGVNGRVIDLATVNGSAYAVVASCTGAGSDYAAGCTRFALYTSPYTSDSFQPVPGASGRGQEEPGGLQLTRQNGYLLAGNVLYTGSPDGGSWQPITISSGTVPACLATKGGVARGEPGLLAPLLANDLYLLCQPAGGGGGSLYTSTDSGATWQFVGHVKARGFGTSLAIAPNSRTLVLATTAGIYYSSDGRHWLQASLSGKAPPRGFSYIGMTTSGKGVAVPASTSSTAIYVTVNGGKTWRPRPIA
ncbi:MAG TPA: hypothetical protein VEV63_14520 [Streptosporangiaceae bacterium]|nr:hypothetical protein [Streptosporangiaceae bacterium]